MKNLLQKIKDNKKFKKRIIAVVSATLAFALFASSVVVYQKSKQNIKVEGNKNQNAFEETLKNEKTNKEAESENSSDAAAENFENESSSDSAQDSEKDVTVPNSEKTSEPSTQNNSSTGSKKPNSTAQNSVKPSEPASVPANKPITTTQPAVTACSHNWKLISYTNGCYVYNCLKCDDYKSEERKMNPDDFMGNKSEYLELLRYVNQARREAGLNELVYCNEFQSGADTRAKELTVNYSHTRPNGEKSSSVYEKYRYTNIHGYMFVSTFENAVAGADTAKQAFTAWMNSSGHKETIMLEHGFGFVASKCDGYWVMSVFCGEPA